MIKLTNTKTAAIVTVKPNYRNATAKILSAGSVRKLSLSDAMDEVHALVATGEWLTK